MIRTKNKFPGTLILVMSALVFIALIIARQYYRGINQSADPRIVDARELYEKYNAFAQAEQYDSVFWLMDTIQDVYEATSHYSESYEVGVLYNNRAAALLSMYLQPDKGDWDRDTSGLLREAEGMVVRSIEIYRSWMESFEGKNETDIIQLISPGFTAGLEGYSEKEQQAFLKRRVKEIVEAQQENPRRLSVSLTNLGTIKRHQAKVDSAAFFYVEAIELWDQNLTAENNLNILLNRPQRKRNLIQKLFPPEK